AALVGRDCSIDWLCWPRFDSPGCFAALLGTTENGRWLIAPKSAPIGINRRYRPGTLILETEFETDTGCALIIDFMPPADGADLVRIIVGRSGRVDFQTELVLRFNYGASASSAKPAEDLFFDLVLADLTRAADLLRPVFTRTDGVDGWVSLEVSP